uniref:Carboxylic ester hydrolase n=1 Tax=Lutzomyia longipalpis TaxID=7200 RepID=A0A1B0EWG9_LUTLO
MVVNFIKLAGNNSLKSPINLVRMMSTVEVKVKQGRIRGIQGSLRNGAPFYAFKGIPYAKPPVGELRFKPPVALESFPDGVLDCTKEGNPCVHKDPYTAKIVGSEDCLFLNVYTPRMVEPSGTEKLPVMVWIHGGAFMMDSGSERIYSPEYLIQEDVIVVTLNYRLGPLGFLFYPRKGITGNAGLKDQLLALKWVQENIEKFGGDAQNVTLFGESAGGASTHIHLLCPKSQPFFHRVICQSGTSLMEWVMQEEPEEKAERLAKIVGCQSNKPDDIMASLMKAPAEELALGGVKTLTEDEKRRGLPIPFKPVVEPPGKDSLLTDTPLNLAKALKAIEKPMILGHTSKEGIIMLLDAVRKIDLYDKDFQRIIPKTLNVVQGSRTCERVADEMRKFYFNGGNITQETIPQFTDLLSDYNFMIGNHVTAEIHARKEHRHPMFFYRFAYDGELNLPKKLFGLGKNPGACHGDDMFYLFNVYTLDVDEGAEAFKIRATMCRMWTNFAKYGHPTPPHDTTLPFKWTPVAPVGTTGEYRLNALEIDHEIRMIVDPEKERMDFWRQQFKLWNDNKILNPAT